MSNDPKVIGGAVDMRHPSFVEAVKNMTKRKEPLDRIVRITGLNHEMVRQIQSENK